MNSLIDTDKQAIIEGGQSLMNSLTLIHTDKQAGPTEPGVKGSDTRIHKDSQGHTGTHRDSQGLTGTHRDSQGLTGTHKDSQGLTALTLTHTDSH